MATLRIQAIAAALAGLIVCVCCGFASVFVTSPAIAASSIAVGWTVEPPATPVGAQHVVLQAVSCAEVTACMAVGYSEESTPGTMPLAEMWNGSRWSLSGAVIASPGSDLLGVSCPVVGWCAAVGSSSQEVFAETWNGTVWTKYTIAAPSGSQSFTLLGVSCTSPNHCLAVGYYVDDTGGYEKALVEEWNGSTWTEGNAVDPNPRGAPYDANSELSAISCASPTSCVAVGEYEDEPNDTDPALAESWNGGTWTVDSTPTIFHAYQTYLNSVSCWAPGSCMAVGGYNIFGNPPPEGNTTSESWNGSIWSLQSVPVLPETFSNLHGVSCTSATFCIGLGYGSPGANYVALWNGAWSYEAFGTALRAVSCVSQIYCMAVGAEEAAVYVSNPENPQPFGGGGSNTPSPPTTPPPPAPQLPTSNPCATTHGTISHDLLASIKCTLALTKLEAECGIDIVKLFYFPAKYLKLVEGAKTLAVLDRLPAKTRPIARFFYDLFHDHYSKYAPPGFRSGAEAYHTLGHLTFAWQLILKIPDMYKAVSHADFSEFALDLDGILGLRPCVQAVADGLAN
jgi:hypothetical protein